MSFPESSARDAAPKLGAGSFIGFARIGLAEGRK
jgi:hypothetical protein